MVDQIHSYIREDLIKNQEDILKLQHYYTHKYRSRDRLLDINVGIFIDENYNTIVQLYVADKKNRIRERFTMENNRMVDTNTIIKRYA